MHLDEWERFRYVLDARRVLRPGGRLYVDNFNLLEPEGLGALHGALPAGSVEAPGQREPALDAAELEGYVTHAGYTDVRVRTGGLWVTVVGHRDVAARGRRRRRACSPWWKCRMAPTQARSPAIRREQREYREYSRDEQTPSAGMHRPSNAPGLPPPGCYRRRTADARYRVARAKQTGGSRRYVTHAGFADVRVRTGGLWVTVVGHLATPCVAEARRRVATGAGAPRLARLRRFGDAAAPASARTACRRPRGC